MSKDDVLAAAGRSRAAAIELAPATRAVKDAALESMADALIAQVADILAANALDVQAGREAGTQESMLDRLALTEERVAAMAQGLRDVAALADPIGETVRGSRLPNGLALRQVRVPLGVVAMVYEARPNVTVDAAGLCLKSGNAVLLRGSASAYESNKVLVRILSAAVAAAGLPGDAVTLVPGTDRESVTHLMRARGLVDVIIPRGGAGLISHVVENAIVPVIETGVGVCHVYVDADSDPDEAVAIVLNSKTRRVSVCNSAETLLIHAEAAPTFLPRVLDALIDAGVTVHGDVAVCAADPRALPAAEDEWGVESLSMDIDVAVVENIDAALAHIRRWGSGHTDAICTRSQRAADHFTSHVDSAAVMVNASTAFTDGAEFGLGAEIGISTQKLHARGPMGLTALTSTTHIVTGEGHLRP